MESRAKNATTLVRWHTCSCEWLTKYCDDNHMARAIVPIEILRTYMTKDLEAFHYGRD